MKFYSTKNKTHEVGLEHAVLQSLPPDGGLYMPEEIIGPGSVFIENIDAYSLEQISRKIIDPYLSSTFDSGTIDAIIGQSLGFGAPLVTLEKNISILELWHGPSLAFKDFGARFMASIMSRLIADTKRKLTILVATSGDTGGAVAAGFFGLENVEVIILYPKNKVSPLQERQLTCLGHNIFALEVDGTFDDCQRMVKSGFLDSDLNTHYFLSSANSINISRLLPQTFYYFEAFKQKNKRSGKNNERLCFCVPSGNFGNLTAGVMANRMGLPVDHFIAATNINDVVPSYLTSGVFTPRPSAQTISNAMDVGNPSNFYRLLDLFDHDWLAMSQNISGYGFTDKQTREAIVAVYHETGYILDPHSAVGYLAAKNFTAENADYHTIILGTAHPAKFEPVVNPLVGQIPIPQALLNLNVDNRSVVEMSSEYAKLKTWLLSRV